MKTFVRLLCASTLAVAPVCTFAEQQVTLKSGATLIGAVAIEGREVAVTIEDSTLRVPLEDVVTIAGEGAAGADQARRLLVSALEARLLNGSHAEISGLLGEAARLAPNDPQIAFWHASSLADAGFGKAANEAFEAKRNEIEKLFPGRAQQLVARINRRVELEMLPEALVRRLDEINQNVASRTTRPGDDYVERNVVFQLVDQHDKPLQEGEFRMSTGGDEERIETYDDGYFLFHFRRRVQSNDDSCKISLGGEGLREEVFNLKANSGQVTPSGKFTAHRFDQSDKRNLEVLIVDRQGKPIAGAGAALQAKPENGGPMASGVQKTSDEQGVATFVAYPLRYFLRVSAEGYQPGGITVNLPDGGDDAIERRVELDKSIPASIRLEWQSTPRQPNDALTTRGAVTLRPLNHLSPTYSPFSPDAPQWIRLVQVEDQILLQLNDMQFRAPNAAAPSWVRVVREDDKLSADDVQTDPQRPSPVDRFEAIELAKLEDEKESLKPVEPVNLGRGPTPPGFQQLPATKGAIYVGKLAYHDHRNGQLCDISFKALVEKVGDEDAAGDQDSKEQPASEVPASEAPEGDAPAKLDVTLDESDAKSTATE